MTSRLALQLAGCVASAVGVYLVVDTGHVAVALGAATAGVITPPGQAPAQSFWFELSFIRLFAASVLAFAFLLFWSAARLTEAQQQSFARMLAGTFALLALVALTQQVAIWTAPMGWAVAAVLAVIAMLCVAGSIVQVRRPVVVTGLAIGFVCVATSQVLTQDVMKVSPETHSVLLENAQVRVLSVLIKPGEEIGMHSHPANVAYYMSDATLRITGADGKVETRSAKAGVAAWSDGAVHTVKNVGTTELREVQIELKATAQGAK